MASSIATKVPNNLKKYLRIGTSSWKYDSWKGMVYDEDKTYAPNDYLRDYARSFNTVEVDQWFWSLFPGSIKLPDKKTAKIYSDSVPDDFMFTVKAPNAITLTNYYSKQPAAHSDFSGKLNPHFLDNDLLNRFLDSLTPLGKKLGPIMFQFEYLNKKKMPSAGAFMDKLGEFLSKAPKDYQYAIETRNPNYLSPKYFELLKEHKLGFVYLEGYYMPPIEQVFTGYHPHTADYSIVRLHGGNRLEIETQTKEKWDQVIAPKPESLKAAADIVRWNRKNKVVTIVNINNHFEGSAPLSIKRFIGLFD